MVQAFKETQSKLSDVTYPFLLIHGDADAICSVAGARLLVQVRRHLFGLRHSHL